MTTISFQYNGANPAEVYDWCEHAAGKLVESIHIQMLEGFCIIFTNQNPVLTLAPGEWVSFNKKFPGYFFKASPDELKENREIQKKWKPVNGNLSLLQPGYYVKQPEEDTFTYRVASIKDGEVWAISNGKKYLIEWVNAALYFRPEEDGDNQAEAASREIKPRVPRVVKTIQWTGDNYEELERAVTSFNNQVSVEKMDRVPEAVSYFLHRIESKDMNTREGVYLALREGNSWEDLGLPVLITIRYGDYGLSNVILRKGEFLSVDNFDTWEVTCLTAEREF